MKDIKGKNIVSGDDVLILEGNKRVPATVLAIGKTKIKFQLREGVVVCNRGDVNLQKITAGVITEKDTSGLLKEVMKDIIPIGVPTGMGAGIDLETLRFFGAGFDKNSNMRLSESQKKYSTYGKLYRLLKEAFDEASEDDELQEVAIAISKVAKYLNDKMSQ